MNDATPLPPPLSDETWALVGGPPFATYSSNNTNGRHPTDRPGSPGAPSVQGIPGLVRLSDVQPEAVHWLWPGRIPLGKLTVIDGDPGLGKSMLTCDLAARVSAGLPMPDSSVGDRVGPAGVVLLSAEDGLADTIRPRLDAAGADPKRVAALRFVKASGNAGNVDAIERLPTLADIAELERAIIATRAALVIIDPLMAYLPGQVKANQDQDVRAALTPLSKLAERTGAAVVVVRHLNKGGGSANPIYRGGGSIGIIGAARCGLLVARDPDDVTGARRIVAVVKSNLAAMPAALAYTIEPTAGGAARVAWQGETGHTAAMLLAIAEDSEARDALSEAVQFLMDTLAEERMLSDDVQKQARQLGIKDGTLRRARKELGIKPDREGFGAGGRWYWQLPTANASDSIDDRIDA